MHNTIGYVYILQSLRDNRYYIGSTNNLQRRLTIHKEGKVYSTKRMLPVELVFYHQAGSLKEARQLEKVLKNFKRHDIVSRIVADGNLDHTLNGFCHLGP